MIKYRSKYSDREVTAAQHIAEMICESVARKERVELPFQFWRLPRWKRLFLYQVQLANGLLKLYKPEAIIIALRKNPKIYSLGAKFLDPLIQVEEEKLNMQEKLRQETEPVPVPTQQSIEQPRPAFTHKVSILGKLREI